jgi:hypothetical protein
MQTKEERERRGVPLSVRIAKSTHDELSRLARAGDKSVTQTVERLLERALRDEQLSADILEPVLALKFGPDVARVLLAIGEAMASVAASAFLTKATNEDLRRGHYWRTDPWSYDQAVKAAMLVLDHARPKGDIVAPPPVTAEERASKFWPMSLRQSLDDPPLDDLRRALNGEPARKRFEEIAARLKGETK